MTHANPIDPELRVLLDEIAHDPKAKLFRTEIPRPERLVLQRVEPVGPAAVGLTAAERELVRVYREDVAKLLRDAAEWKLQQDPVGKAQVSEYRSSSDRYLLPSHDELVVSLLARSARVHQLTAQSDVLRHKAQAEALLRDPSSSAAQLAGLSLRFVPHDGAWIQIGRTMFFDRDGRGALRALVDVVRRNQESWNRSVALTWIANLFGRAGDNQSAAVAYSLAAGIDSPSPNSLLGGFREAVLAGDAELALRAATRLDPALFPHDAAALHWLAQQERRNALEPVLTRRESAQRLALELPARVGPTARMVIDALD